MLTDTHSHLFWESFEEDFDEVIKRSLESGINTIINVGTDLITSREALAQVENKLSLYPNLKTYSSIGIHPHDAIKYANGKIQEDMNKLEEIYRSNPEKVVGVGECGLDFFFENNPDFKPTSEKTEGIKNSSLDIEKIKELQRRLLKAQVDLAKKLNLPLLIHTREAWGEIWNLIGDHFGILHCYSGDMEVTKKALNSKFLISFAATITYPKNEHLRDAAKFLSLDKIVLETDCPFLPPQSKRGTRNEPSAVREIAQLIADLKDLSLDEVAKQTTINTKTLFAI